jgi:hypothetical protein
MTLTYNFANDEKKLQRLKSMISAEVNVKMNECYSIKKEIYYKNFLFMSEECFIVVDKYKHMKRSYLCSRLVYKIRIHLNLSIK